MDIWGDALQGIRRRHGLRRVVELGDVSLHKLDVAAHATELANEGVVVGA